MPLGQFSGSGRLSWSRAAAVGGVVFTSICLISSFEMSGAAAQGLFQELFGGGYSDYRYQAQPRYAPQRPRARWRAARPGPRPAVRHVERRAPPPRSQSGQGGEERAVYSEPTGGSRSYCVRECDGYFFPVGFYSSSSDSANHQRTCNKLCPGAHTTLYVLRSGSDKIEDAVAARGGGGYARLMASLHRRGDGEKEKECSCHAGPAEETPASAIYLDFTLRRGDAVMTPNGMEVFHGGARYPYSKNDFRPLTETRDLPERTRRMLATLERASKHGHGGSERRAGKLLGEHRSQTGGRGEREPLR